MPAQPPVDRFDGALSCPQQRNLLYSACKKQGSFPDGGSNMILADKIIDLRKKAGWSQEELAQQLGVSRQSVSKWEGAQSVPDLDRILALSRLFGVSTDYLLGLTDDPARR